MAERDRTLATSEDLRAITEQIRRATKVSPAHYDHAQGQRLIRLADALDRLHATPDAQDALAALEWDVKCAGEDRDVRVYTPQLQRVLSALRHLLPATPEQTTDASDEIDWDICYCQGCGAAKGTPPHFCTSQCPVQLYPATPEGR